nr:MAG: putative structural protein [Wufeng shrew hepe-like virus 1]
MTDISIATAQKSESPTTIDVGGGQKFDVSDLQSTQLHSTAGENCYPFRIDIPGTAITSTSTAGTILYLRQLDGAFDDVQTALKDKFIYYRIIDLVVTLRSVSPFSTASGSAQVFVNPDPSNPISDTPATALLQGMRLIGSGQLSSKAEMTFKLDSKDFKTRVWNSEWRYCKSAGNPRAELFGFLAVIARASPAKGDGAYWSMTLSGNVQYRDMTYNTTTSAARARFAQNGDFTQTISMPEPNDALYLLEFHVPVSEGFPVSSGQAMLDEPIRGTVSITEDGGDQDYVETYPFDFSNAPYNSTKSGSTEPVTTMVFTTEVLIRRGTDITAPYIKNITITEGAFNGTAVWESGSQMLFEIARSFESKTDQNFDSFRASVNQMFRGQPDKIRLSLVKFLKGKKRNQKVLRQ